MYIHPHPGNASDSYYDQHTDNHNPVVHETDWLYIFFKNPFAVFVSIIIIIGFLSGIMYKLDKLYDTRVEELQRQVDAQKGEIDVLKAVLNR